MLILGLDPGSHATGYGFVHKQGGGLRLAGAGCISCPRALDLPARLARLASRLDELVGADRPDLAVLESPFRGLNSRSLIVLAQARGALIAVLARCGIEVREYSPAEVKSAVTGYGRADKEQVAHMVRLLLGSPVGRWSADATDALAVAICAAHRLRLERAAAGAASPG